MLAQESLIDYVHFPNPLEDIEDDGVVAVGGELSPEFLISAYRQGVFPWFNPGEEKLWWSPNPRCILEFENLHISKTMKQLIRKNKFQVRVDTCFEQVIRNCQAVKRKNENSTWISEEIIEAYLTLHFLGISHSFEVFDSDNQLVGGLYGTSLGTAFYGESMFAEEPNTSKIAFIFLTKFLQYYGFDLLDCQVTNKHLLSLGCTEIDRETFLGRNQKALDYDTQIGSWTKIGENFFVHEFEI
jgi:leucyl/phenylalanyl-tRNA--protein transferase